jgi:hypothetical protein
VHISFAHNCASAPNGKQQWEGTALHSINKASHRVADKGIDVMKLGRWCWTQYRGRNNHVVRIIGAYRPNFPMGPRSVYTQQNCAFGEK